MLKRRVRLRGQPPRDQGRCVLFLERRPEPVLSPWIARLWYASERGSVTHRERVLPTGQAQLVLNLAADAFTGCAEDGTTFRQSPALLVGVRPTYTVIDTVDMQEMVGVVFAPGGLRRFFGEPAHDLQGELPLEDFWGSRVHGLRDRLRETTDVTGKFALLQTFLCERLLPREVHPAVQFSLHALVRSPGIVTVAGLAGQTGLSSRRLGEVFAETVGVGPKCFARIRRFREAVQTLHTGTGPSWAELALQLGYFDQAHFSKDFRAFSGMSPSEYLHASRNWANHVAITP